MPRITQFSQKKQERNDRSHSALKALFNYMKDQSGLAGSDQAHLVDLVGVAARRLGVSRNTVRHLQSLSSEEVLQQKERH